MGKVIVVYKENDHKKNKNKLHKHLGRKCHVKDECEHLPRHFILDDVDDQTFAQLQADPDVEEVRWDSIVAEPHMAQTPSYSIAVSDTAQFYSKGYTGVGVRVGIIDTGFANHEDLVYAERFDASGGSPNISKDGHGTHVAGIIGARNNTVGTLGVAPDCLIYGAKASRTDTDGKEKFWETDITTALNWLKGKQVKVINMSFGSISGPSSNMQSVYQSAYDAGIVLVASAGNDHNMQVETENNIGYPAKFSFVIAVSNIQKNHRVTESSSTGPEINVAAPGYSINSTMPSPNNVTNPEEISTVYDEKSGTSMAAPFVTGLVALYAQMYSNATRDQLINYIKTNTEKLGSPAGADAFYGAGRVITPWTTLAAGQGMSNPILLNGTVNGNLPSNQNPVFYKYTAQSTGLHTFELTGLDYAQVQLFNDKHRHIADNGGQGNSFLAYELEAGQVVYVCVEPFKDWEPAGKSYSLKASVLPFTGKSGEYFSNPYVLQSTSVDLYQAQRGSSIYIKYIPSASGTLSVSANSNPDGNSTSALDVLHLYDANRKRIATNDRDGMHSVILTYNVTKDVTYYIEMVRLFHPLVLNEPSRLTVNIPPKVQSNPGDSLNNPIIISGTSASGTLVAGGSVYYKYTSTKVGSHTFKTSSSIDLKMDLYTSPTGSPVATDDDSGGSGQPLLAYNFTAVGQSVYLRVYGYSSSSAGSFTLNVGLPSGGGEITPGTASIMIIGITSNSLTISSSATNATSFNVYRSTSLNGSYSLVGPKVPATWTDTGLQSNTMYYYKTEGVNGSLVGTQSGVTQARTDPSSGGGVTPVTKLEDFNDTSYNFTFTTNEWSMGSGDANVGITTGMTKKFVFTESVPSGAVTKNLTYKYTTQPLSTQTCQINVRVNGSLKATHTQNDNTYRTNTIALGTGTQTIEFEATGATGTIYAKIDDLSVSWS